MGFSYPTKPKFHVRSMIQISQGPWALGTLHGMNAGSGKHKVHADLSPNTVYVFKSTGYDALWGCPVYCGCNPTTITIDRTDFTDKLHGQLGGLVSHDELTTIANELDEAFHRTHWPTCPVAGLLCLAPFVFNLKVWYSTRRATDIEKVKNKWNLAFLSRGLFLHSTMSISLQNKAFSMQLVKADLAGMMRQLDGSARGQLH